MDWKTVGQIVAKAAPILGTALGGPIGAVAGVAGSLVASYLGVEAEPEAVANAIKDPETLLKLKALENEYREQVLEWQQAQLQAELENVKSARSREIELAKVGHKAAWATTVVAVVVSIGFFIMLGLILMPPKDVVMGQAATLLLGSLSTGFISVVNYYLGSSLGSKQKTDMLSKKE